MIEDIGNNVLFLWVVIMGKKTYRNSVTQRLLDDENFKSTKDYGMHRYIVEQRTQLRPSMDSMSLADCVVNARATSMPVRYKQAYNRAKDTSRYIFGLPMSSISTSQLEDTKSAFTTYIEAVEGQSVEVLYNSLNEKNPYHYGWKALYDDYLYSGKTNEIKKLSVRMGTPCYLVSGQLVLTQASVDTALQDGTITQYGLPMSYGKTPNRAEDVNREQAEIEVGDSDKLIITYTYSQDNQLIEDTETISLKEVFPVVTEDTVIAPDESDYMQSMYKVGDTYKLFTYEYLSGGIEEIDKAVSYQEPYGHYYPRIYTRINAKDLVDMDKDNIKREHTESMMRAIGLDLAEITEQIASSIDDMDGSYKYVFLNMSVAVNKNKDDLITGQYLFNYFDSLYNRSESTPVSKRVEPSLPNEKGRVTQTISDTEYTQKVSYWKSGKSIRTGVAKNNKGVELSKGEHCVKYGIKANFKSNALWGDVTSAHTFIHQNGDNQYTEITVYDLRIVQNYKGNTVKAIDDDENLTVPLDITVVDTLNINNRELLLNKALQITVSTKKVIKSSWYESGIFKVVMAIVAVAMNVIVPGSGLTLTAIMEAVAITVLTSIAINLVIKIAVDIAVSLGLSAEITAILTVIAVGAGVFSGKVDFSKLANAKNMMEATNHAFNMYNKMIAEEVAIVRKKMDEFNEYAESQWEKLSAAQEMLNTGVIPMTLEQLTAPVNGVNINLGETPEDFYTRTLFVDVYDLTFNSVDYFMQAATEIPKQFNVRTNQSTDPVEELLIR